MSTPIIILIGRCSVNVDQKIHQKKLQVEERTQQKIL
jgi:hypothetical protein